MRRMVIACLAFVLTLFLLGCTIESGQVAENIAKSSETVKSFLAEYPNAAINIQLLTKGAVEADADFIAHCQSVEAGEYYKATFTDNASNLKAFAFVDKEKGVVCAYKEGTGKKCDKSKGAECESNKDCMVVCEPCHPNTPPEECPKCPEYKCNKETCKCELEKEECAGEGEEICLTCTPGSGPTECCAGLTEITPISKFDSNCNQRKIIGGPTSVCTKCGNGVCGARENACNCPEDCPLPTNQ